MSDIDDVFGNDKFDDMNFDEPINLKKCQNPQTININKFQNIDQEESDDDDMESLAPQNFRKI